MSNSISSTVDGEQVVHSPTLLQNIHSSSSSQASTLGMCSLTLSGEILISLGLNASSNEFRNVWILNSGATDHMTIIQINLKPIYLVQAIGKLLLLMELPPQWLV